MELEDSRAWLEGHVNLEAILAGRAHTPSLENMRRLCELMGDPQRAYPVIHLTGTNGKGSTARMITELLLARGLSVGTYTSPDLERINERLAWNNEPISDERFAEALSAIAGLEGLLGAPPSRFEILTAAAFRWFADIAVDLGVIEVGMGGRWDATNVADGQVAVVTNVSLDHVEILGPALADIAREKAGIVKPGCTLVLGETARELRDVFEAGDAAQVWLRDRDFSCARNQVAHGGRLLDLVTPGRTYGGVFLPLHGAHQGDNAAAALAAVEAFFDSPLEEDLVVGAFEQVRVPGRMEVVGRRPLCVLDGAHNPAGAAAAARTLDEEFATTGERIVVLGLLRGRDPRQMLDDLGTGRIGCVVACPPPTPRALPPEEVAAAAEALGIEAHVAASPTAAVHLALSRARADDLVLVTGSLYLVGAARAALHPAGSPALCPP